MTLNLHRFSGDDTTGKLSNINNSWDSIDSHALSVDFGWTFLGSGSEVNDFDIDFTVSGKYLITDFSAFRVFLWGEFSEDNSINVRVNNNSDLTHRRAFIVWDPATGTVESNESRGDVTSWIIAGWGDSSGANAMMTIQSPSVEPLMTGFAAKNLTNTAQRYIGKFHGSLSPADTVVTSVRILMHGSVVGISWWAEGFRIPS